MKAGKETVEETRHEVPVIIGDKHVGTLTLNGWAQETAVYLAHRVGELALTPVLTKSNRDGSMKLLELRFPPMHRGHELNKHFVMVSAELPVFDGFTYTGEFHCPQKGEWYYQPEDVILCKESMYETCHFILKPLIEGSE